MAFKSKVLFSHAILPLDDRPLHLIRSIVTGLMELDPNDVVVTKGNLSPLYIHTVLSMITLECTEKVSASGCGS